MGFFGLLQLTFIILKLMHTIDWSWWLVMSPFIGVFVCAIIASITTFTVSAKQFNGVSLARRRT
jgi:ABC-type enterochelin transport system permease subunit